MPSQSIERRKREASSYHRSGYEDYENGKPKDKKQKKLGEFIKWHSKKDTRFQKEKERKIGVGLVVMI